MISLKPGVKLRDLAPQIVLAIQAAEHIYWNAAQTAVVVTSGNDSQHKDGSLHYTGRAADLRIKTVPEKLRERVVRQLRDALGGEFDVLWEGRGTENEHVHVEWQQR